MYRALRHPATAVVALGFVLRAAIRVRWHEPRTDLRELVGELRASPTSSIALDLDLVEAVLERLLPVLPPWGTGRCVKRSLMLLDLWSRAGLTPHLHLGFLEASEGRTGHAWVSAQVPMSRSTAPAQIETWRL